MYEYCLFETKIGKCAIAWGREGIAALLLPTGSSRKANVKQFDLILRDEVGEGKPPKWVQSAIEDMRNHLEGRLNDLHHINVDYNRVPPFHRKVYEAARKIPPGKTASYGELAILAGSPSAARAVGQAMARNPIPLIVPCHRVIGADGSAVGFSGGDGCSTKETLLKLEGCFSLKTSKGPERRFTPGEPISQKLAKEATTFLTKADPKLGALIACIGPFRLQPDEMLTPFEALAESIVYQQLTGKAAATIFNRVKAIYGSDRLPHPKKIVATEDEVLRAAGLSTAKTAAIKDLAVKQVAGLIPSLDELHQMDDEAIIEKLTAVRGVGRWTVEMLLIFRLGRSDVLPVNDYGVRKGFAIAYKKKELPTPKELTKYGERWKPYRSVASWYLWRATDAPEII